MTLIEDEEEREEIVDEEGILGLPSKFSSWRPSQSEMMTRIVVSLSKDKNFVIAELPTGSGKTMISMAARQVLDSKTLYVCTTKSLQDQFLNDFPHAKLIKGRSNYSCLLMPDRFPDVTAEDCPARKCEEGCPYKSAKQDAQRAMICVMNMSYFLSETEHIGSFKGRGLMVIDEADTVEDALLEHVAVTISQYDIEFLQLGEPAFKTKFEAWKEWAEAAKKIVLKRTEALDIEIAAKVKDKDWDTLPLVAIREKRRLDRLAGKLGFFLKHVNEFWVWAREDYYHHGQKKAYKWVFKPVRVDEFGDILFANAEKFILMSATILDFSQYERNVGLAKYADQGLVARLKLGSVFDPAKRPVKVVDGIDLTFRNKEQGMKELPGVISRILAEHPNEKGVIHTVTYDIARALQQAFPGRIRTHNSLNRREVIEDFKTSSAPLVLVSPSSDRGEDFPDDLCRFIVIVKIPYPYLGDERIQRRLHHKDGQRWYTLKTISKIVQMTGRGMRHEDDSCVSYIIDSGFRNLYMRNRSMFPQWWKDALIWETIKGRGGNKSAARSVQASKGQGESRQAIVQKVRPRRERNSAEDDGWPT